MTYDVEYKVYVDFDANGNFTTAGDDITAYVKAINGISGLESEQQFTAHVGTVMVVLNNEAKLFSPLYATGTYYGKLLPGLDMKIEVTTTAGTNALFRGKTRSWAPTSGIYGSRECVLQCADLLQPLQDMRMGLPIQTDETADVILKKITSTVFLGGQATGDITIDHRSAVDSVTINGREYTFVDPLTGAADEVYDTGGNWYTEENLRAALNADVGEGTDYGTGTLRNEDVTATPYALNDPLFPCATVVTAKCRGAYGNAITLAAGAGGGVTVSGATLSGGSDAPAGLISFETGTQTFSVAADEWSADRTNALDAVQDVVQSEHGLFWCAEDGTFTFKNKDWIFKQQATAASLALSEHPNVINGALSIDDLFNHVVVEHTPRTTTANNIIAQHNAAIQIPPSSGVIRWNTGVYLGSAAVSTVVKIPYVEVDSGEIIGASYVDIPQPGTDYIVTRTASSSDTDDLSGAGLVELTLAINGGDIEVSFINGALRALYVQNLTIYGTAYVAYQREELTVEDSTSIAAYGRRTYRLRLPLPSNKYFAHAVATYWSNRYSTPVYRVKSLVFAGQTSISGTNLYSLMIGDVITVTDTQVGLTARRLLIIGKRFQLGVGGASTLELFVRELEDKQYMIVGDAVYGLVGSNRVSI